MDHIFHVAYRRAEQKWLREETMKEDNVDFQLRKDAKCWKDPRKNRNSGRAGGKTK